MTGPQPGIGDWYRLSGGELFEVVALDEDDGTIEIQYFDGTVEEMDVEDWDAQWDDGVMEAAEAPEDWTGSVDVEATDAGEGHMACPAVAGAQSRPLVVAAAAADPVRC